LHYTINTCSDSVWINIHPVPVAQNDTAVCLNSGTFNLNASPTNGLWAGTGITDGVLGTFDPNIAKPGIHTISYATINACIAYIDVTVDELPLFDFSAVPDTFCYNSNTVTLNGLPLGGYWTGNGISGTNQFNAQNAGIGQHTLSYYVSQGTCPDSADYIVTVLDSTQVSIVKSTTTICYGDSILLTASATGGLGVYGYVWDNGIGTGRSHWVKPTATITYTVIASDGCSDNAIDSIQITVHPQILVNITAGPTVCYNDTAYAAVSPVNSGANYTYLWSSNLPQSTDTLWDFAGMNYIEITDQNTGCVINDSIETTQFDYINAFFSKNPNRPCITTAYSTVQMLDYSIGGLTGYWLFGDGDSIDYNYGTNTSHWYPDTGTFPITLYIENIGACSSVWRDTICIEPEPVFDLPNAFTPNDDGLNDVFTFRVVGVFEFELLIFDRWGKNIYRTNDRYAQWDGKVDGTVVEQGVYPYLINYKHPDTGAAEKYRGHLTVIY
jgi:gliding motility-associated-like protein